MQQLRDELAVFADASHTEESMPCTLATSYLRLAHAKDLRSVPITAIV